jgi:hypothetical protein
MTSKVILNKNFALVISSDLCNIAYKDLTDWSKNLDFDTLAL